MMALPCSVNPAQSQTFPYTFQHGRHHSNLHPQACKEVKRQLTCSNTMAGGQLVILSVNRRNIPFIALVYVTSHPVNLMAPAHF